MGKKRSVSSQRWLKEHFDDPFVQKAKKRGLRSRAVFKIEEEEILLMAERRRARARKGDDSTIDSWPK